MRGSEPSSSGDISPQENEQPIDSKRNRTPLPWLQLSIVYLIQFAEPLTATVIYPFINQFVRDTGITGGDERKTGYFAGIIQSVFFFAESILVIPCGMASDRYGRRPILLLGPLGLALAMLGFGMSTTYWPLVVFQFLQGAFNGSIGVSKSVIGEVTDSTNIADAVAFTPVAWTLGLTVGPLIGGLLTEPATRWPRTLGKIVYLKTHPYFLPCLVVSLTSLSIFLLAVVALKETLSSVVLRQKQKRSSSATDLILSPANDVPNYGSIENSSPVLGNVAESPSTPDNLGPLSLPLLLRLPVVQSILINYVFVGFCNTSILVLTPLMWSTSIENGGLGFSPYTIGITLGTCGILNAFLQVFFLGKLIRRFGPRKVHITCFSALLISFLSLPIANSFARHTKGMDWKVWTMVMISLAVQSLRFCSFGSLIMIVTRSAPSQSSLGTMNGLAQAMSNIMKGVSPSFVSSLYSISLERQIAGGNAVYYLMAIIVAIGIPFTFTLPRD